MARSQWFAVASVGALLCSSPALGQAGKSLDTCQKEVSARVGKYLASQEKILGACLGKVAKEVIKAGDPVADAAKTCGAQLRKLENTAKPTKTLAQKTKAKLLKSCDPGTNPGLAHNAAQVLELVPPMIPQGIEAKNLNTWCSYFDNDPNSVPAFADGTLDTVEEWLDCALAVADCHARQGLASQYPRSIEWLTALEPELVAAGPIFADAVTVVQEALAALDVIGNGQPSINCGPGLDSCGDAIKNGTDQCDGSDFGGESCSTLGFKAGDLGCTPGCYYDIEDCVAGAFPATGQTVSFTSNDDGDLENGAPFNLTNLGDGTISDANSGLMWEIKSNDGSMHDKDESHTWVNAFLVHIDKMNNTCDGNETTPCTVNADCTGIGNQLCGHAGYRDWRVPNRNELQTIINLGDRAPAVPVEFDTACTGSCSVLACSCTDNDKFWTSTTYAASPTEAWYVLFTDGDTNFDGKVTTNPVRAVRGGGL